MPLLPTSFASLPVSAPVPAGVPQCSPSPALGWHPGSLTAPAMAETGSLEQLTSSAWDILEPLPPCTTYKRFYAQTGSIRHCTVPASPSPHPPNTGPGGRISMGKGTNPQCRAQWSQIHWAAPPPNSQCRASGHTDIEECTPPPPPTKYRAAGQLARCWD